MAAAISCVSCKRPLRVPETILGRLVQCPLCLEEFLAQADPVAEAAVRATEAPRKRAILRSQPVPVPVQEEPETDVEEFAEAAAWVELHTETTSPRNSVSESAPARAIFFPVLVARDPDRILRGRMDAELTADGLYLRKSRQALAFAAVGGKARYLGANRLIVTVEGREVELTVVKPWTSVYHLAHDTANFLGGMSDFPTARAYDVPWYLYALPTTFAALPFAACPLGLLTDGCFGVFLWSVIAAALATVSYAIAVQPRLLPRTRLTWAGGFVGLGAIIYLLAFFLTPSYNVDPALWRLYIPPEGNFRVKLPGSPIITEKPTNAVGGDPQDVAINYTVDMAEPEVRFAVSVSPTTTIELGFNGLVVNTRRAITEAKNRLQQGYAGGHYFGLQTERDLIANGQVCHEMVYRYSPRDDDIGALTKTLVARVYVTNEKTYTLSVLGGRVQSNAPDIVKFFDSFQIANR